MPLPKISVNIPLIVNGSAEIVLESLKHIDYPKNLFEIIIIEGNHIARQRNIGLRHSKGEIVYLLDDDSQINPDSFKILAQEFQNKEIGAVGGPSLTPQKNTPYLNVLISRVLETYFGAFRMRYKWSSYVKNIFGRDYHFIGANLALRRKAVLEVGMFDEKIVPNEETELLRRLRMKEYLLKFNKEFFIYRNQRKSLVELAKQFHHYGRGRMKQMKKRFILQDSILFAPIIFTVYLILLPFFTHPFYSIPLFLYILLGVATSLKASIKYKKSTLLFSMLPLFPIIHLSYAVGMIYELLLPFSKNTRKPIARVQFVKRFSDDY